MRDSRSGKQFLCAAAAAVVCSAVALGVAGGHAVAAGQSEVVAPASPAPASVVGVCVPEQPIGMDGMRVSVDGRSRNLRAPSPAESAALAGEIDGLIKQDVETLSAQQASDGTLSIVLDGAFLDFAVARVDASGTVVWDCVGDADAARAFLEPAAPAAAPALEER